jgi:hypothetical protein
MDTLNVLREAAESMEEGETALASDQFTEAVMAFRAGLRSIGNQYLGEQPICDSTPTRITLAGVEERKGNKSVAANLLRNALASRIALMQAKCPATQDGGPPGGTQ